MIIAIAWILLVMALIGVVLEFIGIFKEKSVIDRIASFIGLLLKLMETWLAYYVLFMI